MFSVSPIAYRTHDHGDFDEEWLPHAGCSEWWYATSVVTDEDGKLFSLQFTITKRLISAQNVYAVILSLTDFETGQHYLHQQMSMSLKPLILSKTTAQWEDLCGAIKGPHSMKLFAQAGEWSYDLTLDYGKGAFWHCQQGVLQMGLPDQDQTTTYFSYTNMPTSGIIAIGDRVFRVRGKTWFDKQGGSYTDTRRATHWEWFSFRFDDDEEIMLFSFPQSDYADGTYIPKTGSARRLNHYAITPDKFVRVEGKLFSFGWTVRMPGIKDEIYSVKPKIEGQWNGGFFELLADVTAQDGRHVGVCYVELLPGVLNDTNSTASNG